MPKSFRDQKHSFFFVSKLSFFPLFSAFILSSPALGEPLTLGEAIEKTLKESPAVEARRVLVDSARGTVVQAAGEFDWNASLSMLIGNERTDSVSSTTLLESTSSTRSTSAIPAVGKQFREGYQVEITNTLETVRNKSLPLGKVGGNTLALVVTVPLMKEAGYAATTATERTAKKSLIATQLLTGSEIVEEVYDVAVLYWQSLAAVLTEKALIDTFARSQSTTRILENRLKGGLMAPVEYSRSLAELRLREIDQENGRNDSFEARSSLLAKMGISDGASQLEITTDFPQPAEIANVVKLKAEPFINLALQNRLDKKALEAELDANRIDVEKAMDDLRPALDLKVSQSFASSGTRYDYNDHTDIYTLSDNINVSSSVMLALSFPFGNNVAKGTLTSSKAEVMGSQLDIRALVSSIHSEVRVALDKLKSSRRNLERAAESEVVLSEVQKITMDKLSRGEATMTDLISVEDRLTESRLKIIISKSKYAQAIAELRYATGTLTSDLHEKLVIKPNVFLKIPLAISQN